MNLFDKAIEDLANRRIRVKPGNGQIVGYIASKVRDKKSRDGFRIEPIAVYGATPVRTGKRYRDSGYPGSVRRHREHLGY